MTLVSDTVDRVVGRVKETTQPIGQKVTDAAQKVSDQVPQEIKNTATRAAQDIRQYAGTMSEGGAKVYQGSGTPEKPEPMYRSPNLAAPAFRSTKGQRPKANIYKYDGSLNHTGSHGAGKPDFSMGAHPVNFGQGSALPHGAARGSGTPTTGSALNLGNVAGFGSMAHTRSAGVGGSTFGMNDGVLRSAASVNAGAGVRSGGSFGMNDGVLKGAGVGKLNFTQSVMSKSKKAKGKKK